MQAHKHVRYLSTASIGHYFGWVGMSGALFWVGRGGWGIILGGWGWMHCLIMPFQTTINVI